MMNPYYEMARNMSGDELLHAIIKDLERSRKTKNNENRTYSKEEYHRLEYGRVYTKVTDKDMLPFQIDAALDSGDKELFMELVKRMEGVN